jgi:hypothetical protein
VVTDHMLMEPGVRGAKHEADVHGTLIYKPVLRVGEMTRVVVNVDGPNPEGNREGQQGIPVPLNIGLNLCESDRK